MPEILNTLSVKGALRAEAAVSAVSLVTKASPAQTANLHEWQDSAGVAKASVDLAGIIRGTQVHDAGSRVYSPANPPPGGNDPKLVGFGRTGPGLWSDAASMWPSSSTYINQPMDALLVYFLPMRLAVATSIDEVSLNVTVAGVAGSKIRVGYYNAGATNPRPTTLIADLGEVLADTTGAKGIALAPPVTLPAGLFWQAIVASHALTVEGYSGGSNLLLPKLPRADAIANSALTPWHSMAAYGPLPASVATGTSTYGSAFHRVAFRTVP